MATDKIRVGIIGMGGIAGAHVEGYRRSPHAELFAIGDVDAKWLEFCRQSSNVPHAFADYRKMLELDGLDAVSICLPTHLHGEASIAAMNAGKHVLCEKPMATTVAEAGAMAEAARRTGRRLMISFNQRFDGGTQFLRRYIEAGNLGDIYFARTGWRRPLGMFPQALESRPTGAYDRNWFNEKARGGGVTLDLGCHMIDKTMYLLGFPEVERVVGKAYSIFEPTMSKKNTAEDLAAGMIFFKNGLSLQVEVSFGSFVEREVVFVELYGDKGGASLRDGLKLFSECDGSYITAVPRNFPPGRHPAEVFAECLVKGEPTPCTPEEGVAVTKVLCAIRES